MCDIYPQVRNEEKARKMLGPDIDLVRNFQHFLLGVFFIVLTIFDCCQIVADITKENTLVPEKFKGVRKVINAVSVIVGPKEGDTPERQKYNQVLLKFLTLKFFLKPFNFYILF